MTTEQIELARRLVDASWWASAMNADGGIRGATMVFGHDDLPELGADATAGILLGMLRDAVPGSLVEANIYPSGHRHVRLWKHGNPWVGGSSEGDTLGEACARVLLTLKVTS